MELDEKVSIATYRLKSILGEITGSAPLNIYVAHSGGKDSVVVHKLARMVYGQDVSVIHTPKITGFNKVHPDTIDFLYEQAANYGMAYVPGNKMQEYLLYNDLRIQVDGTRADEADRVDRSADVVIDGKTVPRTEMNWFTRDGLFGQACVFPIYNWSDEDVWKFIDEYQIPFSKEYPARPAH